MRGAVQRGRLAVVVALELFDLAVPPALVHEERRRRRDLLGGGAVAERAATRAWLSPTARLVSPAGGQALLKPQRALGRLFLLALAAARRPAFAAFEGVP